MSMAFEISAQDIESVLLSYSLRVTDTQGQSFATMAEELIDEVDTSRIEKAALRAGNSLEEQTAGAYEEIRQILVEMAVLDF